MYWMSDEAGVAIFYRVARFSDIPDSSRVFVDGTSVDEPDFVDGTATSTNIPVQFALDPDANIDDITAGITPPVFDVAEHESVSNRVDVISTDGTFDFSSFSVEGAESIFVATEADSGIIEISTSSIVPSHNPYSIAVNTTGRAMQDPVNERLFDVPEGTAGGVTFTMTATPFDFDGGDRQEFIITSISNIGPISITSLSGSVTNRVVVAVPSNADARTYNVHFRVNYRVNEYNDARAITSTTNHHADENYTVVVESDFYAGVLADTDTGFANPPTALSDFASGDNQGAIANGKSVTVTNELADTGTLYLAIPIPPYLVSTFEITTNGYPIAITEISRVEGHQILEVGSFEPGEDLTFVIQGV